jgi:glycosyltransferase involved in cell wall biosynthesis
MTARPRVSVVVPVLNEEENVALLVDAVRSALGDVTTWELVFVDDGSRDGTVREVLACSAVDQRVRLVPLARQSGQSTAMQAGFDHGRGDVFVSMDGDMQNDPADIPRLLAEIDKGYDLVAGYREKRKDVFVTRRLPSLIANRMIAWSTGIRIRDNGCSLKAYRRELLDRLRLYSDMHRFIPALAAGNAGARITEIPVRHHARIRGKSKYGLSRVGRVLIDLLTVKTLRSLRRNPLRMFGGLGVLSAAIAVLFLALAVRLQGGQAVGPESSVVFTGVSMVFTALSIFLGMLGLVAQVAVSVSAPRQPGRGAILHEVSLG